MFLEHFLNNLLFGSNNDLKNRYLHINWNKKVDIEDEKVDIEDKKVDIEDKKVAIENINGDISIEKSIAFLNQQLEE